MVETVKDFYLIGLTGNLGCGKSTVRRMLEQLGARGIDADLLAHAAMDRGTPAWDAIIKSFGADVLRYDGEIDRQRLGKQVFEDPEALSRLERILHPAVGELVKQILLENDRPVVVLEAIKLIESGLYQWCDAVWVVACSSDAQVERVVQDRKMRPEDAHARLAAQSPQAEKTRLATIVIDNSGDTAGTRAQVEKAWAETVRVESAHDKTALLSEERAPNQPSAPQAVSAEIPAAPTVPVQPPATEAPVEPSTTEAPVEHPTPAPAQAAVPPPVPGPPAVAGAPAEPRAEIPPPAPTPSPVPPPEFTRPAPVPPPEEKSQPIAPAPAMPVVPQEKTEKKTPTLEQRPAPAEQKPRPPQGNLIVQVRPARRADLEALSKALAQAEGRKEPLSAAETLKRLGERGYRIALAHGRIVAMAAWEAENLVAVTRDIRAASPEIARQAFPPLLSLIEQDANSLVCEVSILLTDVRTPSVVANAATASGYRMTDLDALHTVWRQVISERVKAGEKIWVKPLRKELITKPVE